MTVAPPAKTRSAMIKMSLCMFAGCGGLAGQ